MESGDYFEGNTGTEQEGECGRNKEELLQRRVCTRFEPYREFFLSQPIATIVKPNPKYKPTVSSSNRDNLKINRQLQYLKGVLPHDYCPEAVESFLAEQQYSPIAKLKNTSLEHRGRLYWAEETKIKSIGLEELVKRNGEVWSAGLGRGVEFADVHEWIYELSLHGQVLYARAARALYMIQVNSKVISAQNLESQIIGFANLQKQGDLLISAYQNHFSHISQRSLKARQTWCKIDGLINAMWVITHSQVFLCKDNAMFIADRRKKSIVELHRRANCYKDRIYSAISLASSSFGPRYYLTTESLSSNIYDIRKPYHPIIRIPHYCEEAPPSVLQIWDHNYSFLFDQIARDDFTVLRQNAHPQNPLLIVHSPYEGGSSLLTELSLGGQSKSLSDFENKFQILYDSGKIYNSYHPLSITPFKLQTQIGLIHIDNYYGLSLQILEKKPLDRNIKGKMSYQRVNFHKSLGVEQLSCPGEQRFRNSLLSKQLYHEEPYEHWRELLNEQSLQLQSAQNQSNLRFSDLSSFYHTICQRAKSYPLNEKITLEERAIKDQLSHQATPTQPTQPTQQLDPTQRPQNQAERVKAKLILGQLSQEGFNQILDEWDCV